MTPFLAATLLAACGPPEMEGEGLVGDSLVDPFPSALCVQDGRIAIPEAPIPVPLGGTPVPLDRIAWRSGFSNAQVSVVRMDGIDASDLPSWREDSTGTGGVRMADLTDGTWVPVLAELDAHPDAVDPVLIVRPQRALPEGHDAAVVVTTEIAPRPERFDALVRGRPPEDLVPYEAHYADLVSRLGEMGVEADAIALAWDFPVGDGTAPMRSAIAQLDAPGTWAIDRVRDLDEDDRVAPHTFRAAEGRFAVQSFLEGDRLLDLDEEGHASVVGTDEAYLYVHIPESVADAAAGSVPVVVFGHGIFGHPTYYLDDEDDPSGVLDLAEEGGFILVATLWRGLNSEERLDVIDVAEDFGQLPLVPDRLVQGHVNVRTLMSLALEGGLLADPVFQGRQGQLLPDANRLLYYGISLGGIEGAVLFANGAPAEAGVLHVGGAAWSTMLERSTQWPTFELFIDETVPDPNDRQLLYAVSQLFWDEADPIAYAEELAEGHVLLWQESLGDEQVPNMTTRLLARSVGAIVLEPAVAMPWGMESTGSPTAPGAFLLAQFDPELPEPPDENRPPPVTHAHEIPRRWAGTRAQAIDFLTPGQLGTGVHHCGGAPCSASNQGD